MRVRCCASSSGARKSQQLERLPAPDEPSARPTPTPAPEQGETVLVKELRFTGKADLLSLSERARIADEAKGQRLGIAGLFALAERRAR